MKLTTQTVPWLNKLRLLFGLLVLCGLVLCGFVLSGCGGGVSEPTTTPTPPPTTPPTLTPTTAPTATPEPTPIGYRDGWTLVWSDEFDGTEINPDYWTHETGGHGWGNGESQFYTDSPDNSFIEDGHLVIQALAQNYRGKRFTSARLITQDKVMPHYGRIEARIQIPRGQGIWPAFWMLGETFPDIRWPDSGEIDIMENIGREPHIVHGTVHGPGYSGGEGVGASYRLPITEAFADNFHHFAIEWEEDEIRWYVDDVLYNSITPTKVRGEWVFNQPFFLLLNVAVGGQWPGYPDETTTFPQRMVVDYVRIYEQSPPE
jgi:beta-glucanase (GH16 family)